MSKQEHAACAFVLTTKYDPPWIRDTAPGENALCQVECLASHLSWVEWRKPHWAKTGLVVLAWAEILPESSELLRMYVDGKPAGAGRRFDHASCATGSPRIDRVVLPCGEKTLSGRLSGLSFVRQRTDADEWAAYKQLTVATSSSRSFSPQRG